MQEETLGGIINNLSIIIHHHAPNLPSAQRTTSATVLVYLIKGMLGLIETADSEQQPPIIAEIKRLALLYFYNLVHKNEETT